MISGPAYLVGDQLHLTGETGRVTVIAENDGDTTYAAADMVIREFDVTTPDLPVIAMEIDGLGNEVGPETILLNFSRRHHLDQSVNAQVTINGTASAEDYTLNGATRIDSNTIEITFATDATAKQVQLIPVNDGITEGSETLDISIVSNGNYYLAPGESQAQTIIFDAQTNYPPQITLINPSSGHLSVASQNDHALLSVSASDDRTANDSLVYNWSILSGSGTVTFSAANAANSQASFSIYGAYDLRVTVTDSEGLSSSTDIKVIVVDALNNPPQAAFMTNSTEGPLPLNLQVDASSSSDPDGDSLIYQWDFGDGTTATGVTASHTYTQSGNYVITLRVDDGCLATDTSTTTVIVTEPATPGDIIWQETFDDLANHTVVDLRSNRLAIKR